MFDFRSFGCDSGFSYRFKYSKIEASNSPQSRSSAPGEKMQGRITMKKFLSMILVLSMLLSLSIAPMALAESDPVSFSFSWWGGDGRHEATQQAVAAYMAANPNVTISTNYGAWTGWEDSMSTAFYAGSAQDVNQVNWNWLFNYDRDGSTFVDLNTLSDYIDLTQFNEGALNQCTIDGRLSAIPVAMTGRLFFWNETPFAAAGLSVPTSYDELMAAGPIFAEKLGDDFYPFVMNEYDRMIFMVWALECKYGKNWVENGEIQYSKEEVMEGLQLLSDMEAAHVIPSIQKLLGDGAESLDKNPKWIEGKYGGIFEWDSSASKFKGALAEGQSFVVGDYLTGFGEYKGGFTKVSLGFAISQTAKEPVEAAKFINYLLNEEEGAKIMSSQRGIPLSKAAIEYCTADNLLDPMVTDANSRVLAWCSYDLDPTFEDARLKALNDGIYYEAMGGLSYGDYSVEEAADVLMEGIADVIADS